MVRKRKSKKEDTFGLGSNLGFDFDLNRISKSATLANNKMRGKMAEDSFELEQRLQGNDVKKIHKGGDFVVQKRDFFGKNVGKPTVHEIKTGNSQLSEAQTKKKKQLGKRYKVHRY